ncbi:hypothetical protein EMIHUDRAFT_113108 [Emiliania huxleyi CCMP1516]|uniref:Major facilitator superfamily (MFS) profile domain-containing protein n=2 Tax=Emiliania huxleyi TaxID=2903 RepID=A0A0D3K4L0_EMIH1|nr:hypothetical protein EMIHUDRAFT_113108 [Emiliania huxleyi CCMP1516]EOD30695.1 hypothetical protein EMIHUDRAFT_113108 [Emiliania huxleyi CCMP1516]|eukprot:XP_005783124.1 hypothetical protein EMIHUDRAFT_113108 [Emiliania huxleyi CCMP1516]
MAGLAGELPPGAGGCLSAWREAMCEAGGRGNAYDTRSQERLLRTAGEALEEPLSVDECLERAGGWGAYQRSLMLTLGTSTAACAVHMLQPIFLAPLLDWPLTPVQRGLVSSAFFAGYAVGVFGWAWLSDRRGRRRGRQYAHLSFPPRHVRDRPAILLSFLVGNLGGVASFFAPSFGPFLALRLLCGVGVAGAKSAVLLGTQATQRLSSSTPPGAHLAYWWVMGLLLLVASAYALRSFSWRCLVLAHAPGLLVHLQLARSLPESPRFLLVASQTERAGVVLRRVFAANRAAPPEPLCLQQPPAHDGGRSTISQLWRRDLRRSTVVIGLTQGAPLAITAVLAGRFASVAAVNVAYIVAAEIFPTLCRNSGIGWGSGCGRLGAILAPLIMTSAGAPLLLFAALCLVAAASVWASPESRGRRTALEEALPESGGRVMPDVPCSERVSGCKQAPSPLESPRSTRCVSPISAATAPRTTAHRTPPRLAPAPLEPPAAESGDSC